MPTAACTKPLVALTLCIQLRACVSVCLCACARARVCVCHVRFRQRYPEHRSSSITCYIRICIFTLVCVHFTQVRWTSCMPAARMPGAAARWPSTAIDSTLAPAAAWGMGGGCARSTGFRGRWGSRASPGGGAQLRAALVPCGLRAASRARANACVLHCLWINSVSRNVARACMIPFRPPLCPAGRYPFGGRLLRVVPVMYSWQERPDYGSSCSYAPQHYTAPPTVSGYEVL